MSLSRIVFKTIAENVPAGVRLCIAFKLYGDTIQDLSELIPQGLCLAFKLYADTMRKKTIVHFRRRFHSAPMPVTKKESIYWRQVLNVEAISQA